MAKRRSTPQAPRILKATLGSLGRVLRGSEVSEAEAVAERRAGRDIVVCEGTTAANRSLAYRIESAAGPCFRQDPHDRAGPYALPHWQQTTPPPEGHSFYETANRFAARH